MAAGPPRKLLRGAVLVVLALVLVAMAFVFATINRSQSIQLSLGIATWQGPVVHALFAAGVLGLVAMFLFGLPSDLRAGRERRRLERRLRAVEQELESERALHRTPAPEPRAEAEAEAGDPEAAIRNPREGGAI